MQPTYHSMGDHTETIQIDYDPALISYEKLLDIFWASHNPTYQPWSRQYMSAVFYHNDEQKRLAELTKDREAVKRKETICTEVLPASKFYRAEDYHQKYYLRLHRALMREFIDVFPDEAGFVDSTAAARVNGYLGGNGTLPALQEEVSTLGLSPAGAKKLLELVIDSATNTQ